PAGLAHEPDRGVRHGLAPAGPDEDGVGGKRIHPPRVPRSPTGARTGRTPGVPESPRIGVVIGKVRTTRRVSRLTGRRSAGSSRGTECDTTFATHRACCGEMSAGHDNVGESRTTDMTADPTRGHGTMTPMSRNPADRTRCCARWDARPSSGEVPRPVTALRTETATV